MIENSITINSVFIQSTTQINGATYKPRKKDKCYHTFAWSIHEQF